MRPARWCKSMAVCANFLKIPCRQVSHQNKEFCRVMCDSEVAFKKLSKLASTQHIDRQWQGLKSSSFPNKTVKTSQGSDANPALKKQVFQYVWRTNLKTKSPKTFLSRKPCENNEKGSEKRSMCTEQMGRRLNGTPLKLPGDPGRRDLVVSDIFGIFITTWGKMKKH